MNGMQAPDGSFTITDDEGIRAIASFDFSEKGHPLKVPERFAGKPSALRVLREARLAGHLGASMGLDEEATVALFIANRYFRDYVGTLLHVFDLTIKKRKAEQS